MKKINDSTPIGEVSIAQFWELFEERYGKQPLSSQNKDNSQTGRLVYGIRGLEQLLGVSHKTAQRLKDHDLKPAVRQNGRLIVVDVDHALRLFDKKKKK